MIVGGENDVLQETPVPGYFLKNFVSQTFSLFDTGPP